MAETADKCQGHQTATCTPSHHAGDRPRRQSHATSSNKLRGVHVMYRQAAEQSPTFF